MKKFLLAIPVVLLIAAGCNQQASVQQSTQNNKQTQTPTQANQTQTTPTASPTSTPQTDQTANWKIYTSSKYNYQFKYPSNWYFTDGDTSGFDPHLSNYSSVPENSLKQDQVVLEIQGFHTKDANTDLITFVKSIGAKSAGQIILNGTAVVKEIMGTGPLEGNAAYDINIDSTHYISAIIYTKSNASDPTAEKIISTISPIIK